MVPADADHSAGSAQRLLLLSPSSGLGGGIERVMEAVEVSWNGPVDRVDLLQSGSPRPVPGSKRESVVGRTAIARFTAQAVASAVRHRPDVVICGLLGLLPVASAVAHPLRRRLALLTYGLDVWGAITPLERELIRRCTHVIAISSFTAETLSLRAQVDRRQITTMRLPMAEAIAAAAQHPVDHQATRRPLVLTVSRVARTDRFKGHFDIAGCFGAVLERRPDARWIVVGDGDDLPALRAECRRLDIDHAVTFTGRIGDRALIELYRTAAVFALPSFADAEAVPPVGEGFGLVYVEAAAFGLPIIAATPGGGSADFVVHGQTGLTVRPHDLDELAETIVTLLDDPDLRAAIGERARARAFAQHLPVHFRAALHQLLL